MSSSFIFVFCLCIAVSSAIASSPWSGVWSYGSHRHSVWVHRGSHRPHHDHDSHHHDHDHGYPSSGSDQSSDQQPGGNDHGYPSSGSDQSSDQLPGDHDHGYPSSESDQSSGQQPGRRCPHGRRCKDGTSSLDKVWERFSCHCLLKVEDKVVFRQKDPRGLYSCSRRSLYRCSRYCDELFEDDSLRARSRQEACDVLNEEVNVSWYRRSQICGEGEYYHDVPLSFNLCCYRGRPCY